MKAATAALQDRTPAARCFARRSEWMPQRCPVLIVGGEDLDLRIPFFVALSDAGFNVVAAGTGSSDSFRRNGLVHHSYRFDRFGDPRGDLSAIRRLAEIIGQNHPAVVQSFDTKPNILAPLAMRRVRARPAQVRTINGMGWTYSSTSVAARTLRPVYRALQRLAALNTTATVFQNRDDMAYFSENGMLGSGLARLIPGSGIDLQEFDARVERGASPSSVRQALGFEGCRIVITVARLTRQKGIATLLAAAALVHKQRDDVKFVLVGPRESEGPLAIREEELQRHAYCVHAIGRRADVPSLLSAADVCAFPTEYREGVPRVLLEAGLACLPIVTSDMPGCRDVVVHGQTGLLVPPRNPEILARTLLQVLDDPIGASALGIAARSHVVAGFEMKRTVQAYAGLYEELLSGKSLPARPSIGAAAH